MSYDTFRMQANMRLHDKSIPESVKNLMIVLIDRTRNGSHSCYPSIKTIMANTDMPKRTVQWAIRWAKEHGLIEVTEQRRADNGHTSNIYTVLPCHVWTTTLHSPRCNGEVEPLHSPPCNEGLSFVEPDLNLNPESRFVLLTKEGTNEGTKSSGLPNQDLDLSEVGIPSDDLHTEEVGNPDGGQQDEGVFSGEDDGSGEVTQERSVIDELLEMFPSEEVGASWV